MKNIIIDLDGIVADLITPWLQEYNEDYNDTLEIKDVTCFDWHKVAKPECGTKLYDYLTANMFSRLKPLPGAIEAVKELNAKHTVHIVSAHSIQQPTTAGAKCNWVKDWMPFIDQHYVTICHVKHLINGDVIIDDKWETAAKCDASMFKATIAFPWNKAGKDYYNLYAEDYRDTEKCWQEIVRTVI